MNWSEIWDDIVTFFKTNVWNIVLFVAVLLIGIIIIKILMNIVRRLLNKTRMERITIGFLCAILKICFWLVLVLILLSIIGIEITGILTALSAVVLAIGLALEDLIANVANGIVIITNKMFKKGDYIEVDGKEGSVVNINFLFTTIVTSDNKKIMIPNSTIVENPVVDFDSNGTRRVEFKFYITYDSDVEVVKKLIIDCMKSNGKVRLVPEPFCRLNAVNQGGMEFIARCWCDCEDYSDVYFDVLELVYNELKRNQIKLKDQKDGVTLPFSKNGIPKRVEKERFEDDSIDLENMSFSEIMARSKQRNMKKLEKMRNRKKNKNTNRKNENVQIASIETSTKSNEIGEGVNIQTEQTKREEIISSNEVKKDSQNNDEN